MKTNFRIVRTTTEDGPRYAIHRAYYDDKGNEVAVSDQPVNVTARNPVRLRALISEAFKLPFIES